MKTGKKNIHSVLAYWTRATIAQFFFINLLNFRMSNDIIALNRLPHKKKYMIQKSTYWFCNLTSTKRKWCCRFNCCLKMLHSWENRNSLGRRILCIKNVFFSFSLFLNPICYIQMFFSHLE